MTRGQRVCRAALKIGAMDIGQPHLFSLVLHSLVSLLHTHTGVVKTQHAIVTPHLPKIYLAADPQMDCCLSVNSSVSVALDQSACHNINSLQPSVQHKPSGTTHQKVLINCHFLSYWWLDRVFQIDECEFFQIH